MVFSALCRWVLGRQNAQHKDFYNYYLVFYKLIGRVIIITVRLISNGNIYIVSCGSKYSRTEQ